MHPSDYAFSIVRRMGRPYGILHTTRITKGTLIFEYAESPPVLWIRYICASDAVYQSPYKLDETMKEEHTICHV